MIRWSKMNQRLQFDMTQNVMWHDAMTNFANIFPIALNTGILCNVMGPILGLLSDTKKTATQIFYRVM